MLGVHERAVHSSATGSSSGRFFFIHIMKTGGTTLNFCEYARDLYQRRRSSASQAAAATPMS
jgi:hypothetical protein